MWREALNLTIVNLVGKQKALVGGEIFSKCLSYDIFNILLVRRGVCQKSKYKRIDGGWLQ